LISRTNGRARRPEQASASAGSRVPVQSGATSRSPHDPRRTRAMTDYDPRTATGIPTEPVGSLPRPSWLQQAYAQYDAGQISRDQLEAEQDKAVKDSIQHVEATGA